MATVPRRRIPPSIPADSGVLTGALELLGRVEELPEDATGALHCGRLGMVLVEARRVCWAAASGMEPRFAELLKQDVAPPLDRPQVEALYKQCREGRVRFTEALLATGKVSEGGLRTALFSHTVEAIAHLARFGVAFEAFVPHARGRYEARFAFSPADILACLGARTNRELAAAASASLAETLVPDTSGWAFLRTGGVSLPAIVAVRCEPALRIAEMVQVSNWALGLFDVARVFDPDVRVASASSSGPTSVVTWRRDDVHFAALCANRAGAARIVARLDSEL